jgi:hypothetical protein
MISFAPQAEVGALMEYGANLVDLYFRAASGQDSEGHGALRCTIVRPSPPRGTRCPEEAS